MGIWKNAFKLSGKKIVSEKEKELLIELASKVKKRSLSDIMILSLESSRPIHNLGAQSLVFLMPFITMLFKREKAERFVKILENPEAISFFIEQLEDLPEDKKGEKNNPPDLSKEKNGEKNNGK